MLSHKCHCYFLILAAVQLLTYIKALNELWERQVIPGGNLHPTLGLGVLWHWVPITYLAGQVMHFSIFMHGYPFGYLPFGARSGHSDLLAQAGTHMYVVHKICLRVPCHLIFGLAHESLVKVSSISVLAHNLSPTS